MKHQKGAGAQIADKAWRIRYSAIQRDLSPDQIEEAQSQVLALLEEAVEVSRKNNALLDLSYSLAKYAQIRGYVDGFDAAYSIYQEAADTAEQGGSAFLQGHALRHMADRLVDQKRYERAEPLYEEALKLLESDPETDRLSIGNTLRPQAILLEETGRTEESIQRWRETRKVYAEVGIQAGVDECDDHLASLTQEG